MHRIIFLLFILTGFLVMPFHATALDVNDKELLLYFSFDKEGEGVVNDLSQHGNDGNITGTVEWVDGKSGKALKFNQSGEVRAPYIPLNNKSFTVTMWINPTLVGGNQCVFTQKEKNEKNTSLHYRIYPDGKARMGFYGNDLDTPAAALVANDWAHICFWLDADTKTRRIYINDELRNEDKDKELYLGTAGDTIVGSWDGNQRYSGLIDEVMVWDRALTEAEIKQTMNGLAAAVDATGKLATTWARVKRSH